MAKMNSGSRNKPRQPKKNRKSRRVVKPARKGGGVPRSTGISGQGRVIMNG